MFFDNLWFAERLHSTDCSECWDWKVFCHSILSWIELSCINFVSICCFYLEETWEIRKNLRYWCWSGFPNIQVAFFISSFSPVSVAVTENHFCCAYQWNCDTMQYHPDSIKMTNIICERAPKKFNFALALMYGDFSTTAVFWFPSSYLTLAYFLGLPLHHLFLAKSCKLQSLEASLIFPKYGRIEKNIKMIGNLKHNLVSSIICMILVLDGNVPVHEFGNPPFLTRALYLPLVSYHHVRIPDDWASEHRNSNTFWPSLRLTP